MLEKGSKGKILYLLFFVTGVSGLIYQVVWVRMFGLIFGNTIYASSTVLAAFMGGLALGSYLAGRYIEKRSDGLKIYSLMELFIGIFGALMPLIIKGISSGYVLLYHNFHPSFSVLTVIRFVISFIILIIPTTFMGATLPVLSKHITDSKKDNKGIIGKLYGINTLGSVVGCFSSGFVLIGNAGLTATSFFAAALNAVVALTAYYLFKNYSKLAGKHESASKEKGKGKQKIPVPQQVVDTENASASPHMGYVMLVTYALSGFAALALEVAWTRAMVWVMGMDSYAFASMLSVILIGIAFGSLIFSLFMGKVRKDTRLLYILQFLTGAFIIVSIYAIQNAYGIKTGIENMVNESQVLYAVCKAFGAYTITTIFISSVILLIPSILMGISFPMFANIYIRISGNVGRGIGNIYSANTLGGILGSVSMGFFIIPAIGLLPSIALMAGIYFVNALAIYVSFTKDIANRRIIKSVVLVGLSIVLVLTTNLNFMNFLNKTLKSNELRADEKLIYFKEHATGGVLVKESNYYGREMLIDGVQVASTGDFDLHSHLYPAHLMSLLKKDPEDVLVVAFGCGGTSGSVLKYDEVKNLDVVEICDGVVEPAKKYFSEMNSNVFQNPRLNLIIQDGKNYVHMTDKKYDIIYSGPIHPQSNQGSAALYTKDYFEECKQKLKKGGFQCLWLPLHMSSPEDFKTIVKSFLDVYPHVTLWDLPQTETSAAHPHLIGSEEEIYPDYQLVSEKLKKPGILDDIKRLNDTSFTKPYEFLSQFMMEEGALRKWVEGINKDNTDDLPVVEYYKRPMNVQLATRVTKVSLYFEMAKLIENPFQYVRNVPEDQKAELKKQLDRLYEGNQYLFTGHAAMAASSYSRLNVEATMKEYYSKAYKLIPESTYLQNYFKVNNSTK